MLAAIIDKSFGFSSQARRVHKSGAVFGEWDVFRRKFSIENQPQNARLLIMAADYCAVYINGGLCARYTIRSYIFEKAYEVYDVTPFIERGENTVAVIASDTGEEKRNGFSLELVLNINGKDTVISGCEWKTARNESIKAPMTYAIERADIEYYDARLSGAEYLERYYDDSLWENAEIIGKADCFPFEKLLQSRQRAQTDNIVKPKCVTVAEKTKISDDYSVKLGPCGNYSSVFITEFTLAEKTEIQLKSTGGVTSFSVDGHNFPQNKKFSADGGKHTLCVLSLSGAEPCFSVINVNKNAFSQWLMFTVPKAPASFRYPWNDRRIAEKVPQAIEKIMSANSFSHLDDSIKQRCTGAAASETGFYHELMMRRYLSVKDGIADKMLYMHDKREESDELLGAANLEGLCRGESAEFDAAGGYAHIVLDYGRERIGYVTLDIDAPEGSEIIIRTFEMITESGIRHMGRCAVAVYTCKDGRQKFTANRRRGFRYVSIIIPLAKKITVFGADMIETRYPAESAGAFRCNDEKLNAIYDISADTAKVCMMDSYVDCPGFEQNTWTGDARVTALINMVNFGEASFDARYLHMIGMSMDDGVHRIYRTNNPRYISGMYLPCACFPTFPEGGIPIWSFSWALQTIDHYMYFGDDGTVNENLSMLDECFRRACLMTNDRGLLEIKGAWNLIEWANNDLSPYGEVTANNAMLSGCLYKAYELCKLLGENERAEKYLSASVKYKEAVNKYCWDEKKRAYVDTVRDEYAYKHYLEFAAEKEREPLCYGDYISLSRISVQTNTMAYLYGCAEGERTDCMRFIVNSVENGVYKGGSPAYRTLGAPSESEAPGGVVNIGSPFFMYFAYEALEKYGKRELVVHSIKRDFGAMLDDGFKTCVECFRGENGEWGRSASHAWSASPAIYLMTDVLGIKPTAPGYTKFTVKPTPCGLEYASGCVPTPYGKITVSWEYKNGEFHIDCNAPSSCIREE